MVRPWIVGFRLVLEEAIAVEKKKEKQIRAEKKPRLKWGLLCEWFLVLRLIILSLFSRRLVEECILGKYPDFRIILR